MAINKPQRVLDHSHFTKYIRGDVMIWSMEASDIQWSPAMLQSIDGNTNGIAVKGPKGKAVWFELFKTDKDEDDILGWWFRPIAGHVKAYKIPPIELLIIND